MSRIKELYSSGGLREVSRGARDFTYYNLLDIIQDAKILYLLKRHGEYYTIELPKYELTVDLNDQGIGRELALHGIREPYTYSEYVSQIESLDNLERDWNILEIGANIGYYALVPPAHRDDVHVYAAELSTQNVNLLKENISKNNLNEYYTIDNIAVSNKTGSETVYVSDKSNCHSLNKLAKGDASVESKNIDVVDAKEWLRSCDLTQSEVDVVRMDIEGSEYKVLESLDKIRPKIIHLEIHQRFMDDEETNLVLDRLNEMELSIKCLSDKDGQLEKPDHIYDLPKDKNLRLVLART